LLYTSGAINSWTVNDGTLFIGVDLAWAEGSSAKVANDSSVVCIDGTGKVIHAGWTVGVAETVKCIQTLTVETSRAVLFVDAPLIVTNTGGQRLCERQVGQRYGRWYVSANSTNLQSRNQAGVALLAQLEMLGWAYESGHGSGPNAGRVVSECYPYTTIVGAEELGYAQPDKRPAYKRRPKGMKIADFRPRRAVSCDELLNRMASLANADPPLDLQSNQETRELLTSESPTDDRLYKHREDLLDAALCAWTASLWTKWGTQRCQVLGDEQVAGTKVGTIIAPARPEQRG
jgi:predicted RNase H-like nuclease